MGPKLIDSRLKLFKRACVCSVLSAAALLVFVSTAMGAKRKNVLILHEGSRLLPYQALMSSEIQKDLASTTGLNIELFEEYLDSRRLDANMSQPTLALDAKYSGKKIDLIVADGVEALRLMLVYPPDIFRNTPVVFVSVPDFRLPSTLPSHVTGIATHVDYASTVRLAQALQPGLRRLYYIDSDLPKDAAKQEMLQREFRVFRNNLDITFWGDDDVKTLLQKVSNLPPHSAVLFDEYFSDPAGQTYIPTQVGAVVAKNANAPVYTLYQTMEGNGAVGGVVANFETIGRQASRIILHILNGADVSTFPVTSSRNDTMVDWRAFKKFQLPEKQLPPGAAILYRQPTIWERYRWYLTIGGLFILLQMILILKLAIEGKRRKESEQAGQELAGRLIRAQEEERRRIAGELHDDVSQRLALVCLQIDTLRVSPPASPELLVQELSVLYDETDLISSDIHQFSHQLHPSILEKLGLVSALRHYCSEFFAHRKIAVNLSTTGEEPPMSLLMALGLFRIAQECLMNVAKHSGASSCNVSLTYENDRVTLKIQDRGTGFDTKQLKENVGLGIESMRERLRSVGGTLRIESSADHGTAVFAEAPIRPHVASAVHPEHVAEENVDAPVHRRAG